MLREDRLGGVGGEYALYVAIDYVTGVAGTAEETDGENSMVSYTTCLGVCFQ